MDAIETVLVYKFPEMTRQELQAMFQLADLRETKLFQEAVQEGTEKGLKAGKLSAVPALLKAGYTVEQAARELALPVRAVRQVARQQKSVGR